MCDGLRSGGENGRHKQGGACFIVFVVIEQALRHAVDSHFLLPRFPIADLSISPWKVYCFHKKAWDFRQLGEWQITAAPWRAPGGQRLALQWLAGGLRGQP